MDSNKIICCVPNCKANAARGMHHVSFYELKPELKSLVLHNLKLNTDRKNVKLVSNMICGRHLHAWGIRDNTAKVYFPYLKISVRPWTEQDLQCKTEVCRCDTSAIVGSEVLIPEPVEVKINLEKEHTERKWGNKLKHKDHNYSLAPGDVQKIKEKYHRLVEQLDAGKARTQKLISVFELEIDRLKNKEHNLLKKNTRDSSSGIEYPFRHMMEDEQMLKFYTGFASRDCFHHFLSLIAPKYYEAGSHSMRKHSITFEEQLILVLCRLRLGLTQQDLAYRFNASSATIQCIWTFWIKLLDTFLVQESRRIDSEGEASDISNKIIVECYETFFENANLTGPSGGKTYGRAKALIEVTRNGFVTNVSDLFPSHVTSKEILERGFGEETDNKNRAGGGNGSAGQCAMLQPQIQRILGFIKSFKILKGTFPNVILPDMQLNTYWRICCFLINFINKPMLETPAAVDQVTTRLDPQ